MRKIDSETTQSRIKQWNRFATVQLNNMSREYIERDFYRQYFLAAADKLKKFGSVIGDDSAYVSIMKAYKTFSRREGLEKQRFFRSYEAALAVIVIIMAIHNNAELIANIKNARLVML